MNPSPTPEQVAQATVSFLLRIAKRSNPQAFKAYFMGAVVSNVLGNLPQDYWEEFIKCPPCDKATCSCHIIAAQVAPALEAIRRDHLDHAPKSLAA